MAEKVQGAMQGNIASWKKKEGEEIAAGDSIAEIETDKVRSSENQHASTLQVRHVSST